ncbi:hypothetical protein OIU78_016529 [Salix suchowensis]|nr:hypothetical protein OIU78_016529 [Salix suchowensis]
MVLIRLRPERFPQGSFTKLHARRAGPFKIKKKLGANAYVIDLPPDFAISPIFNIEDITDFKGNVNNNSPQSIPADTPEPRVPTTTAQRDEIAAILDHQFVSTRRGGYYKFLVQWKKRPASDSVWLQAQEIKRLHPQLLTEYSNRKAANLRELKNLNHIGGRLEIRNLQGGGIEDVVEAQLKNKKHLLCLELNFCVNYEDDSLIEVLEPSLDLEKLTIKGYGGIVLPNWMMALTRLQELTLSGCGNLEVLPPLGRLPNLESLVLQGLQVRRLDGGFVGIEEVENANINEGEIARVTAFPKLKTLQISSLYKLEEWDGIERRVGEEDATTTSIFIIMPQLQKLKIFDCSLLRALPDYVLAVPLQHLLLSGCPNLRKRYGKEEKGEDWHKISQIGEVTII